MEIYTIVADCRDTVVLGHAVQPPEQMESFGFNVSGQMHFILDHQVGRLGRSCQEELARHFDDVLVTAEDLDDLPCREGLPINCSEVRDVGGAPGEAGRATEYGDELRNPAR